MDLPRLAVILQAALSPNPVERKAAEESLNQVFNDSSLDLSKVCLKAVYGFRRITVLPFVIDQCIILIVGALSAADYVFQLLVSCFGFQFQHTPQHLVRLLQIIVDGNCDLAVRQVASIHFKNYVAKNWSPDEAGRRLELGFTDRMVLHCLKF